MPLSAFPYSFETVTLSFVKHFRNDAVQGLTREKRRDKMKIIIVIGYKIMIIDNDMFLLNSLNSSHFILRQYRVVEMYSIENDDMYRTRYAYNIFNNLLPIRYKIVSYKTQNRKKNLICWILKTYFYCIRHAWWLY